MNKELVLAAAVTLAAVALYIFMAMRVGILRGLHKVAAPAMLGHPQFERAARVHLNTGEQMISFLPLFWLASFIFRTPFWLPAVFGVWFVLARVLYLRLYMAAPESRVPASFLTILPQFGLFIFVLIGLVKIWPTLLS